MTAWTSIHGVMEPCPWRDDDVPWRHGTPSMAPWNEGNAAVLPLHGRIDRKQCRSDRSPSRHRPRATPQCSASMVASAASNAAMLPCHDAIARPQRADALPSSHHPTRATRQRPLLMAASAGSNPAVLHRHDAIESRQWSRAARARPRPEAPAMTWRATAFEELF